MGERGEQKPEEKRIEDSKFKRPRRAGVDSGSKSEMRRRSRSGTIMRHHVPIRPLQRPEQEGSVSRQKIEQSIRAVHVSAEDGGWIVRKTGVDRVRRSFSSEDRALSFATSVAEKHDVGLFVHDGQGVVTQIDVN